MQNFQKSFIFAPLTLDFSVRTSIDYFYFSASAMHLSAYTGSTCVFRNIPFIYSVVTPIDIILAFRLPDGLDYKLFLSRSVPAVIEWYKLFVAHNV